MKFDWKSFLTILGMLLLFSSIGTIISVVIAALGCIVGAANFLCP
jgi:hypothetical protein